MHYKLQDLIDIDHFQKLQDRLNAIYSFPSSIIDNDGNILTATAWQDICTKFHRVHPECEKECIISDQYILSHLHEANPAVSYRCPHGLLDNASPIIIDGVHYGNFFTGQFFLEPPDLEFFRKQAQKYGFDEDTYLEAVRKVPVWSQEQLENYLYFIKGLIAIISESGLKNLREIEHRKQLEEQMNQSEAILQTAMDGFWIADANGSITRVNDTYCRMSGYTAEELLRMYVWDVSVNEDRADTEARMQHLIMQGEDRFESKHRRKNGSVFDIEVSVKYVPEHGGQYICFFRDITERKLTEQQLRQANDKYQALLDNSPLLISEIDPKGSYLHINNATATFLQQSPDDLAGKTFDELFPEEKTKLFMQRVARVLEGKEPITVEDNIEIVENNRHFLTTLYPIFDEYGEVTSIGSIAHDITERKQAERELRVNEQYLQAILQTTVDGFWTLDISGNLIDVNEAFSHMSGFTRDELLSMNISELDVIETPQDVAIHIEKVQTNGFDTFETKHRRKDGTVFDAEISVSYLKKDGGRLICFCRDISDRKRDELLLQEREQSLRQRNEFIETIINNLPIGLAANRISDQEITFINPAFESIYGWPKESFGSIEHFFECVYPDPEYRAQLTERVMADIMSGDPERMIWDDLTATGQDGSHTYIRGQNIPLPEHDLMISTVLDVTSRKQAEDALRESERKNRAILEALPDMIFVMDQDGIIEDYYTPQQDQLFTRPEVFLGKSVVEVMPEKVGELIGKHITKTLKGSKLETFEYYLEYPEGIRYFDCRMVPQQEHNVLAVVRDITSQKRAELALKENEENLWQRNEFIETVLDNVPIGLAVHSSLDQKAIYMNREFEQVYGWPREKMDMVEQFFESVYPDPEYRRIIASRIMEDIASGDLQRMVWEDVLITTQEGDKRYVVARNIPLPQQDLMISTVLDVTPRKQAEMLVQESEEKYRALYENAPLSYQSLDENGCFLDVNPTWLKTLGYERNEIIGKCFKDFLHPDWKPHFEKNFPEFKKRGYVHDVQFKIRHKNGEYRDISFEGCIGYYPDGSFRQTYCVFQDITEQKEAEKNLREANLQLQEAIRAGHVGLWDWNLQTNGVYYSPEWKSQIGYEDHEIGNDFKEWEERVHPDDLEDALNRVNECISERDQQYQLEFRFRHKDGHYIWIMAQASVLLDDANNPVRILGSHINITERKKIEDELRQNEKRYKNAERMTHLGSWEMDIATGKSIWSDEFFRICGYEQGIIEPTAELGMQIIHPDDRESAAKAVNDTITTGKPYDVEKRIVRPDGEIRWVHSVGEIIYDENETPCKLSGSFLDITESKQAEQSLRDSEGLFRSLVEQAADGFELLDVDGYYLDANTMTCEMLGYTYKELIGKHISEIDPNIDKLKFQSVVEKMKIDGTITLDTTHKRKDQSLILVEVAAKKITIKGIPRILSMVRDVSERKQAEMEREKLEAQLNQAQKMEAVGRLAGGVAHDFNNMLNVILGNTELLMNEVDPENPLFEDLQEIHNATERSANLTRQLLAFARKQTITPQVLNLNETISGMLKMLQRLIGEDIKLVWTPGEELWTVRMDPGQIDQILANLCVNSRDAITDVGMITIVTENTQCDQSFCNQNPGAVPGEYVKITVTDTGTGMDAETLENAFEPFYTTKDINEGTGLGLATVYGIIKQNNGFITISSEQDHGTSIELFIPRHIGKTEQLSELPDTQTDATGNETILLVEDETSLLRLGRRTLTQLGYEVLAAASPVEAIHIASEYSGHIHILITDVIMPEMNGRDLAKRIISMYPDIKCLFMSGYTADVIAHRGVLDKGVHFIQKPYTKNGLAAKVRDMLKHNK